jgi:hypothetical protein
LAIRQWAALARFLRRQERPLTELSLTRRIWNRVARLGRRCGTQVFRGKVCSGSEPPWQKNANGCNFMFMRRQERPLPGDASDIGICNHAARLGMHCGALGITGPSLLRGSESPCSKSPTAVTRRFEAPEAPHLLEVRLRGYLEPCCSAR